MAKRKSFEEWFAENGYDEQYKEAFRLGWNGCLSAVCEYFGEMEGTDHDAEKIFTA